MTTYDLQYWTDNPNPRFHCNPPNEDISSKYRGSDWYTDTTKRSKHNWGASSFVSTWYTVASSTYKNNIDISSGMDGNGTTANCKVRLRINSVVVETYDAGNVASFYHIFHGIKSPENNPIYLERLSQLANNSRVVTRNSKSL